MTATNCVQLFYFYFFQVKNPQQPAHKVWGASVKVPGYKPGHPLGSVIFLVILACLIYLLRKVVYRDFVHIILKHIQ